LEKLQHFTGPHFSIAEVTSWKSGKLLFHSESKFSCPNNIGRKKQKIQNRFSKDEATPTGYFVLGFFSRRKMEADANASRLHNPKKASFSGIHFRRIKTP
jgi:hypothetical protein